MSNPELESQVQWRINSWFPELEGRINNKLKVYLDELIKANRTLNLISVKTITIADALHVADSINASRLIYDDSKPTEITDFGSGNGFPGIVFAILYPNVKVHLVDTDIRKCEFLTNVTKTLELKNVDVVCQNIERLGQGSVKFGMMRQVGTLTKSLLIARKSLQLSSVLYHIKTDNWGIELAEIPSQLCSTFEPSLLAEYKLPIGEIKFAIIKTVKIKND